MGRRPDEQPASVAASGRTAVEGATQARPGPQYAAGPALSLTDVRQVADGRSNGGSQAVEPTERDRAEAAQMAPVPTVRGTAQRAAETGHANTMRIEGRTDATFGSSFRTDATRVQPASGCAGCAASDCVRATGILVASYRVQTRVTVPRVADFPNLTPCQRQRVQDAITNVLVPHEQQHVDAFRAYNGITRTPYNLTICRADFDAAIRSMFEAEDRARQAAAQAASDALDPFHFDVDITCDDAPARQSPTGPTSDATPLTDADPPDEEDEA